MDNFEYIESSRAIFDPIKSEHDTCKILKDMHQSTSSSYFPIRLIKVIIPLLYVTISASLLSSCSPIIGMVIGYEKAQNHNKLNASTNPAGWKVEKLKKGDALNIKLFDGDSLKGKFKTRDLMPLNQYDSCYKAFRNSIADGDRFPAMLEPITVYLSPSSRQKKKIKSHLVNFNGFSYTHLIALDTRKQTFLISLEKIDSIAKINQTVLNGEMIRSQLKTNQLPSRTQVILKTKDGAHTLSANMIDSIQINAKNHTLRNALIGLGIDATTLIIIIAVIIIFDIPIL